MGSRYGRNKRRAHRLEIAKLATLNARKERELIAMERRLGMLNDFDERIRRAVGQYSALRVEPACVETTPGRRMPVYRPLSIRCMMAPTEEVPQSMDAWVVEMNRFVCEIENHPERYSKLFKIYETNNRGNVIAINISEDAIPMGLSIQDVWHFSRKIGEVLCRGPRT